MPGSFPDPTTLIPVLDGIPGPWRLLAVLLYVTFVLHLLLVNAVVGVSAITLAGKLRTGLCPLRRAELRDQSVLLPKGVALVVNFAIPPFLFIQALYGQVIYPGSVMGALWWLSVMAVVMLAYYGLYINMTHSGISERIRVTSLAIALLLLLWNTFLLVNNSTVLQSPARWAAYGQSAHGLLLNSGDPQLLPRYLHVLLSCLAVGGLCLSASAWFRLRRSEKKCAAPEREYLLEKEKNGLSCFFYATLAQLPVGGWFFMSLPPEQRKLFMSGDPTATILFIASLFLTGHALLAAKRGSTLGTVIATLCIIFFMAGMRSLLRADLLESYFTPSVRAAEAGPILLFLGSLAVAAVFMVFLVKVYRRNAMLPILAEGGSEARARRPGLRDEDAGERVPQEAPVRYGREHDHDVMLVNEIAAGRMDRDEWNGASGGIDPGRDWDADADGRPSGGERP